MENKNQPAYPVIKPGFVYADGSHEESSVVAEGLTKRDLIAAMDSTPIPDTFCHKKLSEFNERRRSIRKTDGHPFGVMTEMEIAECRASWKVLMADALLKELEKQ